MVTAEGFGRLPEAEHGAQLRKAVIAATVGTTIEWYDFFIYGTAAGLVFGKLFFPNEDPLTATLAAFGTYFVGFVGRPIGAAIFGHYGDRIGRKATLIATLMCMGLATFAIALVPTYDSIGIWGAVILTILRVIQGIGVGGEWGGSVLISMEWARGHGNRGLVASWPQFGVPAGLFLSNLVILAFSAWAGDNFLSWGWRIPFLLSIILVGVGLWVRLGILETPVFQKLMSERKIEKAPIAEVIRRQPREILLSALLRMAEQAPFYIFTAFVFAYATRTLNMSRDFVLTAVLCASVLSFVTIPLSGHISDRIGRRKMYLIGAAVTGLFGFLYFGMIDTAYPSAVFIAIVLSLIPHDMMYGPQAALIAEAFTPRLRYSGASLGYQLASIIAGGPAPLIATALFAAYQSGYAIAIYIAACAVVSLISAALMPDYTGQDISAEYDGTQ
ncbi:MFS transporter [Enhydrobacter sp.]|jgi:metabolite-proton symporter|uniref:MFS transporter n=1 Tax=Enhydrobacter sp. TaxID=1894999 RepID=UPI002614EB19|nr:MFS transporter [Enhydrobacter sp.]WIM11790.1 MAG: putative MFS-type transporter [Enhydrobacter sp.]